jgi:hypothetical protein
MVCFQDQRDATLPGKANTTVMKRLHDWHKSQIIRNIRYTMYICSKCISDTAK